MKVIDLTKHMNDHGTHPKIHVRKYENGDYKLCYHGKPDDISAQVADMTVNSFTVRGIGFIEIFAMGRDREEA